MKISISTQVKMLAAGYTHTHFEFPHFFPIFKILFELFSLNFFSITFLNIFVFNNIQSINQS